MLCHPAPLCVLDQRVVTQNQGTEPTPSQNDPGHKTRILLHGTKCANMTAAALCAERRLDHFTRVDAGLRQRAAEQLAVLARDDSGVSSKSATNTSCGSSASLVRRKSRTSCGDVIEVPRRTRLPIT